MNKFEAELAPLEQGKWKMTLLLPNNWGHEMKHLESPAGHDVATAKTWATDEIRARGCTEQFGWYLAKDGKYQMQVTV